MKSNENKLLPESFQYIREVLDAIANISNKKTLDEIAKETCKQVTLFVGASSCAISEWDKEDNSVKIWAEYFNNSNKKNPIWDEAYNLSDYPLTSKVLHSGVPQLVRLDDPKADEAELALLKEYKVKALLMLPLFSGDEIIGLVEIANKDKVRAFSKNEITLVMLLLNQVGIAIKQTSLLKEAKQRTAELSAIREVNLGLTSSQSLDDVLNVILKSTLNLFHDAMDAHIFIYDQQKLHFGAALWADGRKSGLMAEPREDGLTYTVAKEAKIKVVEDISTDPLFNNSPIKWEGAIIGLPLKNQNRVVGVMNIAFKIARQFDEDVLQVLSMLGGQAAVAIERSHNVELIKKRAVELEALRQVNLALTASLDLEDVINTVLKSALSFSDAAMDAHIFIKEGDELIFGGALWADGSIETEWNSPRENGLTHNVAKSGKIIAVPNVNTHELYSDYDDGKDNKGFAAIIGLPIIAKEEVIGVMNLAYNTPQIFSDADLDTLALLSDQAALAIENARLHKIVSEQAVTDALTGLPNRRAFEIQLQKEVFRSKRYKHQFVLVMLDLNNFKWVNDTYGHPIGDKTLQMVGAVLKENIRKTDVIARMGGDEFGLILPETKMENAIKHTEKLARIIKDHPFPWWKDNEEEFFLTITVGIACYPGDADTAEELTLIADQNFYKSKKEAAK